MQHLDVPNLRGRKYQKDHEREKGRSGSARDAESYDEFDFGLTEEVKGSNRMEKPELSDKGEDEAKTKMWPHVLKGLKIEDKLEIANPDKSGDKSETID